jgi:MoaA/NifB/PqqE/SkfB family radical SAM enzyme
MKAENCSPMKVYVSVTNNCNMFCRHCCYNSGPEGKDFISMEAFEVALSLEPQALLNIGGGEPTCHPLFWDLMSLAIRRRGVNQVWIATNGKRTDDALELARMIGLGVIRGVLSQDKWHEPVEDKVVKAFRLAKRSKSAIRDISKKDRFVPIYGGRCDWGCRWECVGDNMLFVQPNGEIRQCACEFSPIIGDVFFGYKPIFSGNNAWRCAFGKPSPGYGKKQYQRNTDENNK